MTPGQAVCAAGVTVGLGAAACAVWASVVESDAPGWRSKLALGGATLSVVLVFVALAVD